MNRIAVTIPSSKPGKIKSTFKFLSVKEEQNLSEYKNNVKTRSKFRQELTPILRLKRNVQKIIPKTIPDITSFAQNLNSSKLFAFENITLSLFINTFAKIAAAVKKSSGYRLKPKYCVLILEFSQRNVEDVNAKYVRIIDKKTYGLLAAI